MIVFRTCVQWDDKYQRMQWVSGDVVAKTPLDAAVAIYKQIPTAHPDHKGAELQELLDHVNFVIVMGNPLSGTEIVNLADIRRELGA